MKRKLHGNTKIFVTLSESDLQAINSILNKGVHPARKIKRANVLKLFHEKLPSPAISRQVGVSPETARRIADNYNKYGLEAALNEKKRTGTKKKLSDSQKQQIAAIACADPPEGRCRWTTELVAVEAVKRGIVDKIGHETVRLCLRNHGSKPWREKNVVRKKTD